MKSSAPKCLALAYAAQAISTLGLLSACALQPDRSPAGAAGAGTPPLAHWVELGPHGALLVRAVVDGALPCPTLLVDAQPLEMAVRVAAGPLPVRDGPGPAPPANFEASVCEATLPTGAHQALLAGHALPLPPAVVRRLVVIGDTGCRIKNSELQDCSPEHWPFAQLSAQAAGRGPDLVLHMGDYHYREGPCPPGNPLCKGSPLGYGWNVWKVDFFDPAAPLLSAAPWVMVRGNHEECRRAGQGWYRLLAAEPFSEARSCNAKANDGDADYSAPYAVPLGDGLQLVVFDSARAGSVALDESRPDDARTLQRYQAEMAQVQGLAGQSPRSWFTAHHPVLGYAPDYHHPDGPPLPGNPALQAAMRPLFGTQWYPPGVELALHGHVHLFQAIDFASGQPATLVAGNGGDLLDIDLSATITMGPADGVTIGQLTHASRFGYLWMERDAADGSLWTVQAFRADGSLLTRCEAAAGRLKCTPSGLLR